MTFNGNTLCSFNHINNQIINNDSVIKNKINNNNIINNSNNIIKNEKNNAVNNKNHNNNILKMRTTMKSDPIQKNEKVDIFLCLSFFGISNIMISSVNHHSFF